MLRNPFAVVGTYCLYHRFADSQGDSSAGCEAVHIYLAPAPRPRTVMRMHAFAQIRLTFNQDRPLGDEDDASGLAVQEAKPELKAPPMYKVVMFNDDYTPMEFVVVVRELYVEIALL